ncbi:MAG: decaprenyl-phosphate phosphoribosyltransferase [Deltaproteobacteria bacterium]|nr:decaprenyl-phosphate phosphoribosyltransferase [Deltaproteobacteria bacterium]
MNYLLERGQSVQDHILFLIFKTMRPRQWTKNLILFAALIFSQSLFQLSMLRDNITAFIIFCFLSGSVYILNDLIDLEQDRNHPKKCKRPLASGKLKPSVAIISGIILVALSLISAFCLNINFAWIALGYFILQIVYSTLLKHIVILDVLTVSAGFVLRAIAGGEVIEVPISSWLLICTILLALFLALGKRRHELLLLEENAVNHRKILYEYSPGLLDQMISVTTASTVITYALYTMSAETIKKFQTDNLKYTIPFVLYGIFRYLYLIHQRQEGGSPEKILLNDKPLIINIILYLITIWFFIYA